LTLPLWQGLECFDAHAKPIDAWKPEGRGKVGTAARECANQCAAAELARRRWCGRFWPEKWAHFDRNVLKFLGRQRELLSPPLRQKAMLMPRILRRWIARLLLGTLLFAQLAVAAYACPTVTPASQNPYGAPSAMGATNAPAIAFDAGEAFDGVLPDAVQPGLCLTHCQSGQQNADTKSAPGVPLAMMYAAYPLEVAHPTAVSGFHRPTETGLIVHSDPPHAILHCCFRL
jgi:hypothetical protein